MRQRSGFLLFIYSRFNFKPIKGRYEARFVKCLIQNSGRIPDKSRRIPDFCRGFVMVMAFCEWNFLTALFCAQCALQYVRLLRKEWRRSPTEFSLIWTDFDQKRKTEDQREVVTMPKWKTFTLLKMNKNCSIRTFFNENLQ